MIQFTTESIHHFTCEECFNWWSYATIEAYIPEYMTCPHCGWYDVTNDNNMLLKDPINIA